MYRIKLPVCKIRSCFTNCEVQFCKPQSCYTDTKAAVLLPICFEIRIYNFLGDVSNLASILYSTFHSTSALRVLLLSRIESFVRNHFMHLKIVFVFGTWRIRKLSSPFTKALVVETMYSIEAVSQLFWFYYYNVNKNPTDATVCRYLFTAKLLYMFRVSQHPSSGVLKTVHASCRYK